MKFRVIFVPTLLLVFCLHPIAAQQAVKRIAITTNNKGKFPDQQNRIAEAITSQLAGHSGLTILDNEQVEQILKNQNQQNSDRYSPEGAVRIGKLLGAGVLVVVQVADFSSTSSVKRSGTGSSKTIGNVMLEASVRMTNMETGVVLAQPTASFNDTATLSESSSNTAISILTRRPAATSTQGDAQAETKNLINRAISTVSTDLAGKIEGASGASKASPGAPAPVGESARVAGIVDGAVYINKGSAAGIKIGDRFLIIRTVELPLIDPDTKQHLTSKKTICTFITKSVDESNASGSCDGGIPQQGDAAQAQPH